MLTLLIAFPVSINNDKVSKLVLSIFGFLLLYLVIGSATFNNDWIAYTELFEDVKPTYDLFYFFNFKIFKLLGFSFLDFYLINQCLIFILILYFLTRFTSKFIFVILFAILVIAAPNLSILLRYYTAFTFFLVASYFLVVKKKHIKAIIFLVLSITSHFGAIILFIFFLSYKYLNLKKSLKIVFTIAISLWALKGFIFYIIMLLGLGSFSYYLIGEESSLAGGVFASLPYIPWIIVVLGRHLYLSRKNIICIENIKYSLLYKLSMFSFFFLILAFSIQIILHRYVEPFIIIWSLYLCYTIQFSSKNSTKYFLLSGVISLVFVSTYFKYIFPIQIKGDSEWLIHYLEVLNSNRYEIFKGII